MICGSPSAGLEADDDRVDRVHRPAVRAWRATTTGVASAPSTSEATSAGMVAAEVKAPDAPSRTSQPSAPNAATASRGSRWNCSVSPVIRKRSAKTTDTPDDDRHEAGGAVLEVAEREEQHASAARDRRSGSMREARAGRERT